MEEIKFRAWTGTQMEYRVVVGMLGAFYVEGVDPNDSACMSPFNTKYSEQTPIMQFTGLHDKNGKEIYEGDVIERGDYAHPRSKKRYRGKVIFQRGYFEIAWNESYYSETLYVHCGECEIIGNIYENSELLTPAPREAP